MARECFDLVVVGAGGAGLMAALFAARRGGSVALIDRAPRIGGTLLVANGQMSAAGTRLQRDKDIDDSPDRHFEDVMRISRGTADPVLVRLAVDHAATTFDWLMEQGLEVGEDHPVLGHGHEPYSEPRYYWGPNRGQSVLDILEPLVREQVHAGRITLALDHDALSLHADGLGRIDAVETSDASGRQAVWRADNIVLATGGYSANPDFYREISGVPQHCALAYPHAQGGGHKLGLSVGGYLRGSENLFTNFGFPLEHIDRPSRPLARVQTSSVHRLPWEIYVNRDGERFVREDDPSVDSREQALLRQADHLYWIIFDDAVLDSAPPILIDWTRERMREAFAEGHPSLLRAPTLEALADKAGIARDGLIRSVDSYNRAVAARADRLGRLHLPRTLRQPPFYAIRQQGCTISSAAGLAVDGELRLIRADGSVIDGLYAIGELLGAGQTMGKAACGGMMITPALTFGRLLGERLPMRATQPA